MAKHIGAPFMRRGCAYTGRRDTLTCMMEFQHIIIVHFCCCLKYISIHWKLMDRDATRIASQDEAGNRQNLACDKGGTVEGDSHHGPSGSRH